MIIIKIMQGRQSRPENLAAFAEVPEIGQAVIPAGIAAAPLIDRRLVFSVA